MISDARDEHRGRRYIRPAGGCNRAGMAGGREVRRRGLGRGTPTAEPNVVLHRVHHALRS